jgi:phosphate transport system permease protein
MSMRVPRLSAAAPGGATADLGSTSTALDLMTPPARSGDAVVRPLLMLAALFSGSVVSLVIFFVMEKALPLLRSQAWAFVTRGGWDQSIEEAWSSANVIFGAKPLILASIYSTVGAVLVSLVLGIGCAIVLAELAPASVRRPVEAVVQLLAGIPSVVFGLVGLSVVVPFITDRILPADAASVYPDIPLDGTSLMAAIVVLSFMILPFFVTVAVDSLRAIPRSYLDGGLALGLTKWRTITRIQIPAATPGLIAGIVLAAARAIGEAIAISMVAGAIAYVPSLQQGPLYFLLMPVRTMASAIVESGAEAMSIPQIESALFGLAAILLVFSLLLSLVARWSFAWFNKRMRVVTDRHV